MSLYWQPSSALVSCRLRTNSVLQGSSAARKKVSQVCPTVPKTDSGGLASNAKTIGETVSKELCKITP